MKFGAFEKLKSAFGNLPMRRKMWLSYAIPIIIVSVIMLTVSMAVFQQRYRRQLENSVQQETEQAGHLIENYVNTMLYLSGQLAQSDTIRTVLADRAINDKIDSSEEFREYLKLEAVMGQLEMENTDIRLGIYLPDHVLYTNNRRHYYPLSLLTNRSDFEEIRQEIQQNGRFYTFLMEEVNQGNFLQEVSYFSVLLPMEVTDAHGITGQYFVKAQIKEDSLIRALKNSAPIEGTLSILADEDGNVLTSGNMELYELLMPEIMDAFAMQNWEEFTLKGYEYFVVSNEVGQNGWRIVSLIPQSGFQAQYGFILVMLAIALTAIIVLVGFISGILSRFYGTRVERLSRTMQKVENGEINTRIPDAELGSSDEIDALYRSFNYMIDEVRRLMKQEYQLGKSITRAEMRALQAQINPHFLYNTLDLINWGAMDYGADNVAKIARDLGVYYRLSLNHGSSVVSIADEIRHIEAFVRIENVHYDGAITLEVKIPEELKKYACLNTILQPIVENSIVHGIAEHSDIDTCRLVLSARKEGDDIFLCVQDDGKGMDDATAESIVVYNPNAKGHGYGISNTNFRLQLCYGEEYGISYSRVQPHGTLATVRIRALMPDELKVLVTGEGESRTGLF